MINFVRLLFISVLPGIELRGSIPFGIAIGMNPLLVVLLSIATNIVLIPLVYTGLNLFWKYVEDWKIVESYVKRLRNKSDPYIDKYGSFGVFFFVSVPLPGSGVYTGVLIAWLLGMEQRKAILPITFGVLVAATIMTILSLGTVTVLGL